MNILIRVVKSPLQPDNKQQWDVHYSTEGVEGERCLPVEFDTALTDEQCTERATALFNQMQPVTPE